MKIILFSDGTGNSSAKLFRTNVWRLYEGLDLGPGTNQIAFYDNGVGTSSFKPLAVLGGAFGFGMKRNVLDIYKFLCRNYAREGTHQIYVFGFSRGAFTVRVLLGLIRRQGLVRYDGNERELSRLATWAYRMYRSEAKPAWWLIRSLRRLRDRVFRLFDFGPAYSQKRNIDKPEVEFVGVWDTVSAYGLPIIELTRGWDLWVWPLSLPTRDLYTRVKKACHALSLDDERQTFHPLLWDEAEEPTVHGSTNIADERVSQVWFAGMHSNLGGGYPDDGMSYDSLVWIAAQSDLILKPGVMDGWMERRTPTSPMADSRHGVAGYYRYQPRSLAILNNDPRAGVHVKRPKVHESVFVRLQRRIHNYAPIVFPERYAVVGIDGAIHDLPAAGTPIASTPVTPENLDQARLRCEQQQTIWDFVWLRRAQYFLTVFVTCVLVLLPFLGGKWQDHFLSWSLPTIGAWISALAVVLPGWLSPWLDYFHRYPLQLVAGAILVFSLMAFGSAIERRIQDTMWAIWHRSFSGNASRILAGVRTLRTSPVYQWLFTTLRDVVVPNVFGFVMLVTIILGFVITVRRLTFDAEVLAGYVCGNAATVQQVGPGNPQPFDTKNLCQPTGFVLEQGATYNVELKIRSPWLDNTHSVPGLEGFASDRPVFYAALPLRRHMRINWFVPIARVGSLGDEYYPLTRETTTITPRLGGQLFVYVNDALWFYPVDKLYRNNSGEAVITVTKVTAGGGQ